MDALTVEGRRLPVEVLESLVRSYLVRPRQPLALDAGARVELTIGETPPVPCTVVGPEGDALRLLRGWGRA